MKQIRQCLILAGGFGTRLGALTASTPKPLLDCGGKIFLEWILRELIRFGIDDVVLLSGYRSEQIVEFANGVVARLPKSIQIRVSVEPEPAGTGGALYYAKDLLRERFLLINGDSWIDTNLAEFMAAAGFEDNNVGSLLLRQMEDCSRYGTVKLEDRQITAFEEKAVGAGPGLISGGIYALTQDVLKLITPICSLEKDVLPVLAAQGKLTGKVMSGYFIDIGVPDDYERACHELPRRLLRPAVFFDRDGVLNKDLGWVGSYDRFHWLDGSLKALRMVTDCGMHVFIVTNQAGVAKGFYSEEDVVTLQDQVLQDALDAGATIDDYRYCPFHPQGTVAPYQQDSDCRKPEPGMILDLMAQWQLTPERCLLIGDKSSDIKAAEAGGMDGFLFSGGRLDSFVEPLLALLKQKQL